MNMKSKAIILPSGYPIINEVANIIKNSKNLENLVVVTPSRRSLLFLSKRLSEITRTPMTAPLMFSIEDYINFLYEKYISPALPLLSPLDAVYFINEANKNAALLKTPSLDTLLPWAFKLFSDFEELKIEGITHKKLAEVDLAVCEESFPEYMKEKIAKISTLYKEFYELVKDKFSTRAIRYVKVSELDTDFFKKPHILFGFYALTNAEKTIFSKVLKNPASYFIAHKDDKIENYIKNLDVNLKEKTEEIKEPQYHIIKASSPHSEIFALQNIIEEKKAYTIDNVVVLPDESHLFAIVNNIHAENRNISAGYPLLRTPFFSLFSFIEQLISGKEKSKYLKSDYLNVILHPYIKNTRFGKYTLVTRILMHTIEEKLKDLPFTYVSLEDIEESDVIEIAVERIKKEAPGIKTELLKEHLKSIHDKTIRTFENISSIGEFIEKVISLMDFVYTNSTARLHPYGSPFMEATLNALLNIKNSLLSKNQLSEPRYYFNLLKNYIKSQRVPFKGTPLSGLQILGTLETRNLNFKRVFYLDMNEGVIPDVKKEDTILSDTLREYLGLPTAKDRENITRYYFFNLIKGAEEVYLFYTTENSEPSRYIEMIKWQMEKNEQKLDALFEKEASFNVTFSHKEPTPVEKTPDIIKKLQHFEFSPTQLDAYLKCPLKFYFQNFIFPEEPEKIQASKNKLEVGNIVHAVLEEYFKKWLGKEFVIEDIEKEKQEIFALVEKHFGDITSNELFIQQEQIKYALSLLLEKHKEQLIGIKILGLEKSLRHSIKIDGERKVWIKGKIDRVHEQNGKIHIIDYKTGSTTGHEPQKNNLPTPENRENWDKIIGSFQLPLYIILYHLETGIPYEKIEAKLWAIREIRKKFEITFSMEFLDKQQHYENALKTIIKEILDPDIPFYPVLREKANNSCSYCSYEAICDRLWAKRPY